MNNKNEVSFFIEKYNTFLAILSIDGMQEVKLFNEIFIDWLYLSLLELDQNGLIDFDQYTVDGIERDYPIFIDNYTGKVYDLFEYNFIDEQPVIEH